MNNKTFKFLTKHHEKCFYPLLNALSHAQSTGKMSYLWWHINHPWITTEHLNVDPIHYRNKYKNGNVFNHTQHHRTIKSYEYQSAYKKIKKKTLKGVEKQTQTH